MKARRTAISTKVVSCADVQSPTWAFKRSEGILAVETYHAHSQHKRVGNCNSVTIATYLVSEAPITHVFTDYTTLQ